MVELELEMEQGHLVDQNGFTTEVLQHITQSIFQMVATQRRS